MARRRSKVWKQPVGVSKGVGSVLNKLALAPRLLEIRVLAAWSDAVGDSIARRSEATTLERGTLHVTVESSTWMTELKFIEKDILLRVNERYAETVPVGSPKTPAKRLRLHVGVVATPPKKPPPPEPPPLPTPSAAEREEVEKRLEGIVDPEVRSAARGMLLRSVVRDRL